MSANPELTRPYTLERGKRYLRGENGKAGEGASLQPVIFVAYDPCPALVVVQNGDGRRWRCPRDEIFVV